MIELVSLLIDFIERIGPNNALILVGILFILLISLIYLSVVLESFSSGSALINIIRYGKYEVVVMESNKTEEKRIIVFAWNKINAIEKVAKKVNRYKVYSLTFKANKI